MELEYFKQTFPQCTKFLEGYMKNFGWGGELKRSPQITDEIKWGDAEQELNAWFLRNEHAEWAGYMAPDGCTVMVDEDTVDGEEYDEPKPMRIYALARVSY